MECFWAAASAEPIAALNPRLLSGLIEILGICLSAPLSAFGSQFEARERSIPHFEPVQPAQAVARSQARWITTTTSAAELSVTADAPARTFTFRWRTSEDDKRDAKAAEHERAHDEGKLIEHEAGPELSNNNYGDGLTKETTRNRRAHVVYYAGPPYTSA